MVQTEAVERSTDGYVVERLCGLAAVSIWAGNIVVAGLGLRSSLTPMGYLGDPLWRRRVRFYCPTGAEGTGVGPSRAGSGWRHSCWVARQRSCWRMQVCCLRPASHAGALFPGVMPLMVAMLAAVILHEAFTPQKQVGFALIATGVVAMVWGSGGTIGTEHTIGHVLFSASALAFACYTVALRWARLDGLHAAAISAVGFDADLHAAVRNHSRRRHLRGAAGRHSPAGACPGAPDRRHLLCRLWSRQSAFSVRPAARLSPPPARR